MNRLQKKCFLVSAGSHLLLGCILVVGPAFLSSKSKSNDMPTLDAIPAKLIDEAFSNPGSSSPKPPTTTPTPPAPPVSAPPPPPPPPPTHTETPHISEPVKLESQEPGLEPAKKHKIDIALTPVTHHTNHVTARNSSEADERAREDARRKDMVAAFKKAASGLSHDVSSPTDIDVQPYSGRGSGEAYANYGQAVISIYKQYWVPPEDASSDNPITRVSVTISSDGTVVDSHIIQSSGDASVDHSVQRTLDRVTYIAPFPEGAKDKQRTYIIKFDLKARRLQG
jgi:TonB family protein